MENMTHVIQSAMMMRQSPPSLSVRAATSHEEMEKAAVAFESYFVGNMLNTLFETIPTDGFMGGGLSEHMFRSLLLEEYGKNIAQSGGIGISRNILRSMEQKSIPDHNTGERHHDRVI